MVRVAEAVQDPACILAGLRARGIKTADDLAPAIKYLRDVEDREFTSGIAPAMDDGEIAERLGRHKRSDIGSVLKMLVALKEEIGLPRDHAHAVVYHPDKPVRVDGRQERQNRVSVHYRKQPAFSADMPVLVSDASGDAEVYRRLFGDRLEVASAVRCEAGHRGGPSPQRDPRAQHPDGHGQGGEPAVRHQRRPGRAAARRNR